MSAEDIDNEESRDELLFDDNQITVGLDILYNNTIKDTQFAELYISAASAFMSIDPMIGQATLCSYDNLYNYIIACKEYLSGSLYSESTIKLFNKFKITI